MWNCGLRISLKGQEHGKDELYRMHDGEANIWTAWVMNQRKSEPVPSEEVDCPESC